MNIEKKKNNLDIIPPLHHACINGDLDVVKGLIEHNPDAINIDLDINNKPLNLAIKYFLNSNFTFEGDSTPKYWDSPFIQIALILIKHGADLDSEILHTCLFNEKPIFSINDIFEIFTNIENKFPLHNAIEISNLCDINSLKHDCFKKEYLILKNLFKHFTVDFLDKCRNICEAKQLILTEKNGKNCIDLALEIEDKEFLSHKYVQTEFEDKWTGESFEYSLFSRIFRSCLPFCVSDYKWYTIPCIKFYIHTIFYCVFLFLLYMQTYTLTQVVPNTTEILIFIWVIGLIITEVKQFRSFKLEVYLADKWNYFDIFILFLFICIIILRCIVLGLNNPNETPHLLLLSEKIMSINIILSFLRILNVCQIHPVLGPLLLMLKKMMNDMGMFFCILSVFVGGFSLGLTKIYHRLGNTTELFTISSTCMKLFCALFGNFEMADFKSDDNSIEFIGILIFMIYLVIAVIILINLFIAMLSNTYAIIQEDSDIEWKYSRVSLIITYSRYSSAPPPINIFSTIYEFFFKNSYQIEQDPYLVDEQNEKYNDNLVHKILVRYHNKKEIEKTYDLSTLKQDITKLTSDIKILYNFLNESFDCFTPNYKMSPPNKCLSPMK